MRVENGELKIKFHLTFKFELTTKIHKLQTSDPKQINDGRKKQKRHLSRTRS